MRSPVRRRLADLAWWRAMLARDHVRLTLASIMTVIIVPAVAIVSFEDLESDLLMNMNLCFSAFSGSYLLLTLLAFWRTSHGATRAWAAHQTRASQTWWVRWFVGEARGFSFVVSVTMFAVIGAVLLIRSDGARDVDIVVGVTGVILSWLLLQTSFTLHYALAALQDGELEFDDEPEPDMMDFAYLAFTVGTSFTLVDARITSRRLRRVVLGHSLLSFAFNTVLLGLVVTFLAG